MFVLLGYAFAFSQTRATGPWTLGEYLADIDRLAAAVANAAPSDANALASSVPLRWRVDHQGREIEVDGSWLIHALREAGADPERWPARRAVAVKRLTALRTHAAAAGQQAASLEDTGRRVRLAAGEILTRPEFQQSATVQWIDGVQQRMAEWVRALFRGFGGSGASRRQTAIVVAWLAGAAAFAGLGFWLARLLGRPSHAVGLDVAGRASRQVSAREWARRAASAARNGNHREAVRCAYNAALLRVEEQGAWRVDPSRTPREYLRLLAREDVRRPAVGDLTEQFEQVWYGNRMVNEDDLVRVNLNLERLGCLHPADRAI
jgi:hypothetical protein